MAIIVNATVRRLLRFSSCSSRCSTVIYAASVLGSADSIRKAPVASKWMAGAVGVAAATGAVEITLPVAIVAAAYIIGQAMVDTSGD